MECKTSATLHPEPPALSEVAQSFLCLDLYAPLRLSFCKNLFDLQAPLRAPLRFAPRLPLVARTGFIRNDKRNLTVPTSPFYILTFDFYILTFPPLLLRNVLVPKEGL